MSQALGTGAGNTWNPPVGALRAFRATPSPGGWRGVAVLYGQHSPCPAPGST